MVTKDLISKIFERATKTAFDLGMTSDAAKRFAINKLHEETDNYLIGANSPSATDEQRSLWGYVLEAIGYNLYKIGMTRNTPDERVSQFSPNLPFETKLIGRIPCTDGYTYEHTWHHVFRDKRKNGEWFELDESDLKQMLTNSSVSEDCLK